MKVFVFEIKVCSFCLFQILKLFCRWKGTKDMKQIGKYSIFQKSGFLFGHALLAHQLGFKGHPYFSIGHTPGVYPTLAAPSILYEPLARSWIWILDFDISDCFRWLLRWSFHFSLIGKCWYRFSLDEIFWVSVGLFGGFMWLSIAFLLDDLADMVEGFEC